MGFLSQKARDLIFELVLTSTHCKWMSGKSGNLISIVLAWGLIALQEFCERFHLLFLQPFLMHCGRAFWKRFFLFNAIEKRSVVSPIYSKMSTFEYGV